MEAVQTWLAQAPAERLEALTTLRETLLTRLPAGFEESVSGGFLHYTVPHATYPAGYHCDPKQPLPFISVASQKNFIALYHMGLYANETLYAWFTAEWPKHVKTKLDMGKSCIRFKKPEAIPFELLGELFSRMSPSDWIELYEANLKR